MTTPAVNITEQDGKLGIVPPSFGRPLAIIGVAESGPTAMPAAYARSTAVKSTFGAGPMPELAIYAIEKYGIPVLLVRTGASTAGTIGTLVSTMLGSTSVPTLQAGITPNDDHEIRVRVEVGGTVGTPGIILRHSTDDGRTESGPIALGNAVFYVVPGTGGARVNLAAGTLVAGATMAWRPTAPRWNTAEVQAALDMLKASVQDWEIVVVSGDLDGTAFDTIDAAVQGMRDKMWIGHTRLPNVGETEAAYLTALSAIFSSRSTTVGAVVAGGCEIASNGRKALRPFGFAVAAREGSITEEVNSADPNLGSLRGVSIRDDSGNPKHHDETVNPGLDDLRLITARTHDDYQGVYVNRPLLLSPTGSDFDIIPKRRVMNTARRALRVYFTRRLNKPIRVSRKTGFILEEEAKEIERGAEAFLDAVLGAKPKISGRRVVLSRTDNILSSKRLTVSGRVIPFAYPEGVDLDMAFENPALSIVKV